ncbi:MAG: hypothetical protein Q7S13_02510, partial [Candidatus Omnitrophota bacterium]|nr:hypothetical protein [Candidatus Omnitrophota bacterium]
VAIPQAGAQPVNADGLTTTLQGFGSLSPDQKQMVLSTYGMDTSQGFPVAKIIAWVIFGGIGTIAFIYGKKMQSFKPMLIGIGLIAYPYFINSTLWLYVVGVGLTSLLYVWRD